MILESPLNENQHTALEFYDVHQVDKKPDEPGGPPGDMHAKNIGDRRSSSDDRQIAFVAIMKRANLRLPFQARSNRLRRVGSALHGHLRDSRQRLPLFLFGMRQIAKDRKSTRLNSSH